MNKFFFLNDFTTFNIIFDTCGRSTRNFYLKQGESNDLKTTPLIFDWCLETSKRRKIYSIESAFHFLFHAPRESSRRLGQIDIRGYADGYRSPHREHDRFPRWMVAIEYASNKRAPLLVVSARVSDLHAKYN